MTVLWKNTNRFKYASGSTYKNNTRSFTNGRLDYSREASLLSSTLPGLEVAPYYERAREQYKDKSASDFVHLKDEGTKGDGATDDTKAVQDAFNKYKGGSKLIYVDAGTYILKDTVTVPSGIKWWAKPGLSSLPMAMHSPTRASQGLC